MRILLALTLGGSATALLLLALRYVFLRKMPSTVYYYAWLLVLLRFALPLPGLVPAGTDGSAAPAAFTAPAERLERQGMFMDIPAPGGFIPAGNRTPAAPESAETAPITTPAPAQNVHVVDLRSAQLWLLVWAAGTALCAAGTVVSYKLFTVRVRRSLSPATREDRRVYAMLPGPRPKLCRCAAFETPLMFGVFRPIITLPERAYDEQLLANILRHELMHYRRLDTFYKWFAVAVLSTQWFNPLAWLIRRELGRACELSCDEMLLGKMDRADRQSYGETLLSMAASGTLPAGVVATTFSTEKKNLKERLEQIMHYKKSGARVLAALLAMLLLTGCAVMSGPLPQNTAAPAGQADPGSVVRVTNVDELLAAIGPDRIIELAAGTYDLSTAANYGEDTHSSCYSWNGVYDGFELVVQGVRNLTIQGAGRDAATIAAVPRYANVLRFSGCGNIVISGLTAGHTTEPGYCAGGVLYFEHCDNSSVSECGLYGCGTIGVQARDCGGLTVDHSDIYECSYGALSVSQCRDVRLTQCEVYRHGMREGQGSALNLFDANYSERVVIDHNKIHDNSAQYLLNLDYTRGALFLSNEVRDNDFIGSVFSFNQYGATVDGCVFEGNDVHGGWYSGTGVYAGDIDGNLLEGALFNEMLLRDIDPETASPLASVAGAKEMAKGAAVEVTNVDDFLAAIGPERTIILDGELFDLSEASNYGGIGTEYYYWAESYDGPALVIHDADGLSIQAKNSASGATTLAAIPRYADVLAFRRCDNLFLGGFTAGHTKEPGVCSGGVLNFQNCSQVTIEKMRLYGCGILGIQTAQCSSLSIQRTEIYECSQGAGSFFQTDGIGFYDCSIYDVPSPALSFRQCGDKTWNEEPLSGLDGEYDVNEAGALVASARGNLQSLPTVEVQADSEVVNFFLEYARRCIVNREWGPLADHFYFPLTIFTSYTQLMINNREEFFALDLDNVFDADYRDYVGSARISTPLSTDWGYLTLDDALCFALFYDEETGLDVPKITALLPVAATLDSSTEAFHIDAFNTTPPFPFEEGTPPLAFAQAVQRDFAERDWNSLADKLSFPLFVMLTGENHLLQSREEFLEMVGGNNPLTEEFCDMVANADLASYGVCELGSTFAAHRLAFVCVSDMLTSADDLRVSAISVPGPLYSYAGDPYVQVTPEP